MHRSYPMLLLFLSLLTLAGMGQKKTRVTATGMYEARDLTIEQTRAKALDEAKSNALREAGVSESIQVANFLYTFEDNERYQDIFQAYTSTETGGEIIVDKIIDEKTDINEFGNISVEVTIEATVFTHKKSKDPELEIRVDNVKEYYPNNSYQSFTVIPSQDGYMKIFNITETDASLLYPYTDKDEPAYNDLTGHRFIRYAEAVFPQNPNHGEGYFMEIEDNNKSQEFNLLIFVFTKKNIPFMEEETVESIMQWIYSIPPDQRTVEQVGFIIRR